MPWAPEWMGANICPCSGCLMASIDYEITPMKNNPDFDSLAALQARLKQFAVARDWEQFHSPKNLAMAMAGEVGEVMEHLQWLSAEQSDALPEDTREALALELADVLFYLLRLADRLGISMADAASEKLAINEQRYPAGRVRGSSRKYNEYE